ncbi:hypothetical protein GCM10027570_48020 [Streptomonospora sediminis]
MAAVASRVVLGVCSAFSVAGGAALVAMVIRYFGANDYVPVLTDFGWWGILAGMCAFAVYVGGAFRANLLLRVGAGLGLAGGAYAVSAVIAFIVSFLGDPGGERGNLADGTTGFLWLAAGAYFLWQSVSGRWPVSGQER